MLLELLALLGAGKLIHWSFGGGVPKRAKIVLKAEQDMKDGKITEQEYNEIWWKTMMP